MAEPALVIKNYYDREDHRGMLDCIMSLPDPEKTLRNVNDVLIRTTETSPKDIYESGLFYIKRDENSTIEETLSLLEKHFGFKYS